MFYDTLHIRWRFRYWFLVDIGWFIEICVNRVNHILFITLHCVVLDLISLN